MIAVPSIEIRPPRSYSRLDAALTRLADYDWLILTSVNGVEALFERLAKVAPKRKLPAVFKGKLCAIGPATRAALEEHGMRVDLVPKQYVAESVVRALRSRVRGKRVLLVRARVARDVIPRELRRAGATVDVVEAYQTVVPKTSRARLRKILSDPRLRPHAVTFTSSSTARNFVELVGKARRGALAGIQLASIGPVTSATLRELGLRADIEAREFTMPGLVAALVRAFRR